MEARENIWKGNEELKSYLSHINWDWWFLKGQLIVILIIIIGVFGYFWFS